ncbi:hypothetical protein PybrP1_012368 [[Pythium] brassicae (nom. inval.)]|nr:hypothetical protein PybrP1_012368 [[Pythium] brassicae (nom. inval.)]
MTTNEADESALARNLLHAVLALAFPEELATAEQQQQTFLAQLPQLKRVLAQRRVFALAASSAALAKFHARLWALLEQASDARVRAAALELQLLVLQQCGLEQLEQLTPKLVERVIRVTKQQPATPALAPAFDVAAALVRHIELLTPEVRRDLYDSFAKLLPPALAQLLALGAKSALARSDVQLWASGVRFFVELLDVSPNALRTYAGKIEAVCALLFQFPAAFASDDGDGDGGGDRAALAAGAKCLGLLANASDKTPQTWKHLVERAVEVVHVQVDLLSGKRSSASTTTTQQQQHQAGARGWAKDGSDAQLSVFERAERLLQRVEIAAAAIGESMQNRAVSEREVQLVLGDVLALVRRALAVRAAEIGKQSAVSEDGVRLPASVVYGLLPRVQKLALRVLAAAVERAGVCALRHASQIVRVLRLASENGARDSRDALCAAIAVCARALGASTVEKLGVPLLADMVARCKADLANELRGDVPTDANSSGGALADKKRGRSSSSSKGKKRKRQAESGVAQLAETADALPFVSRHAQLLLARSVDAALAAIATLVAVYGSALPLEARAAASDLARLAVQQRARHKFLLSAAASATAAAAGSGGMDAIALLLLADAASADSTGAHGANVVAGMRYWQEHARHAAVLNGSTRLSTTLQLVALSAGDALLHPRAPPLSISFQDAVDARKTTKQEQQQQQQRLGGYATARGNSATATASSLRGRNDWNDAGEDDKASESDEADGDADADMSADATESSSSTKRTAVDAVSADNEAEEEEEEEEEDYDDVRPTDAAPQAGDEEMPDAEEKSVAVEKAAAPVAAGAGDDDDDDDDEFPDIVVDDDADE